MTKQFKTQTDFKDSREAKFMFISCSDFRFRKAFCEFQEKFLEDSEIDIINVPGGVLAFFAERYNYPDTSKAAEFWTKFLGKHHKTRQVILVAHEGCATYESAPKLKGYSREQLKEEQKEDLLAAKQLIEDLIFDSGVRTFYAEPEEEGGKIIFSEIV